MVKYFLSKQTKFFFIYFSTYLCSYLNFMRSFMHVWIKSCNSKSASNIMQSSKSTQQSGNSEAKLFIIFFLTPFIQWIGTIFVSKVGFFNNLYHSIFHSFQKISIYCISKMNSCFSSELWRHSCAWKQHWWGLLDIHRW